MSIPVVMSRAASRDFHCAFVWHEEQRIGLGTEFLKAIDRCLAQIQAYPEAYAVVKRDLRVAIVSRFPYLVVFRKLENRIRITAIVHGSRHPRNWTDRG